ncbi:hypothetical protein BH09ACT10_BH09ACT10_03690 [soil metagenome]
MTLSLDATVVLLTPVLVAAAALRNARPYAFASVGLANSASTLLPVSNLTNLLVFGATGLSFIGFTRAMAPVWVVAIVLEFVVLRWWFRDEVGSPSPMPFADLPVLPWLALVVVAAVLVALVAGVLPAIAAIVFVWGTAAAAIARTDWAERLSSQLPDSTSLGALLVIAFVAMVAANLINNLPATLLLLPAVAAIGPAALLALLIGVNVGANLTLVGSLANILWWRSTGPEVASLRTFHLLGITTSPLIVAACTAVLWAWTALIW